MNETEISVVVQGPWIAGLSTEAMVTIRKHFPKADLIFSTCNDLDSVALEVLREVKARIILSLDPGESMFREFFHKDVRHHWIGINCNTNRQIVSTLAGLSAVTNPYVLKVRSDCRLESTRFLSIYEKYKIKKTNLLYRINSRVLVDRAVRAEHSPFYVSDFYHFGATKDVIQIFDSVPRQPASTEEICKCSKEEFNRLFMVSPEQYIFSSFVGRNVPLLFRERHDLSQRNIELSNTIIDSELILLEDRYSGIYSQKYPDRPIDKDALGHDEWLVRQV